MASAGKLFTRDATGLVRSISGRDAFTLNMSVLNPGQGYIGLAVTLSLFLNAQLGIPLLIGAIAGLFLGLTYVQLVAAMPRTGGDFIFVSRIINPQLGAAIGGAVLLLFMQFPGYNADFMTSQSIPSALTILSSVFHAPLLASWSHGLSVPWHAFIVGGLILALLGYLTVRGVKVVNRTLTWAFIVGMVGFIVVVLVLLFNGQQGFVGAFGAHSPVAYGTVIHDAVKAGYHPGFSWQATWGAIPYMALLYWGFTWSVYPGGELKTAARTTRNAVLGALVTGMGMYLVVWLLTAKTLGWTFLNSVSYLFYVAPKANPLSTPPLLNLYTSYLTRNPILDVLIAVSFVCWSLIILLAYFLVLSRVVFALSFDRVLPTGLANVNEATNSPVNAVILALVGILIVFGISEFSSLLGVFTNSTLGLAIVYVFVSLAGALLPYRKPDVFKGAPALFSGTFFGLPWVTVIGFVSFLFSLGIVFLCVAQPSLYGAISIGSIVATLVTFLWGVAAFYIATAVNRRRGLDLRLAFQEIPPE